MALNLKYNDDSWDTDRYPSRVFKETSLIVNGVAAKSFEDITPYYSPRGTYVTGAMLGEMVQTMNSFIAYKTQVTKDALRITQTNNSGTLVTQLSDDGQSVTRTFADNAGNTLQQVITMESIADGSMLIKSEVEFL